MFIGLGPAVYLLMIRGRIICMGTIGTANNARVSFGIPASISFRPDRESAAAKAICGMNDKTISYEHLLFAYLKTKGEDELQVVMGIGWIFIIDHRFKVNERLSIIIG